MRLRRPRFAALPAASPLLVVLLAACQSTPPPQLRTPDEIETQTMLQPARLERGDTLMFVAPASGLDKEHVLRTKAYFESAGYEVKMHRGIFADDAYLAGSDKRRAKELMQAFLDPEVDAVFPLRGGYGSMRILDRLDFEAIRANPKIMIGFSDITALHMALNRQVGLVTFHTPAPMWYMGREDRLVPFTEEYFWKLLVADESVRRDGYTIEIPPDAPQPGTFGRGSAQGRLTGGNLSMISALEGTPFAIDTRDAILLIEDAYEAPYRIDRMLRQLQLSGKLRTLRGAVLGQFTHVYDRDKDQRTEDPRFTAEGVLGQYFEPLGIPVLMNFPVGHHPYNVSLPLGALVEVDADAGTLRILPW